MSRQVNAKRKRDNEESVPSTNKKKQSLSCPLKERNNDLSPECSHTSKKKNIKEVKSHKITKLDKKFVGAHVSISGGMYKAVEEAVQLNAKSFAMFLKSQRQWNSKPLEDNVAERFRAACLEHNYSPSHIVPHGSYLMNCGSPKEETRQKSHNMLLDELKRCEKLGLTLFNFHQGSTLGQISVDECLDYIADGINKAHKNTKYVIAVLENMCCQGNTVGGKFIELRGIIERVQDKSRVGICLDTCHAFAAGYNLKTADGYQQMMKEFEEVIGMEYLKAVHINDSKGELGCHLDRHEVIGKGKIGKSGFKHIMNDDRFNNIPFILETPQINESDDYSKEIKLLNSMVQE